MTETGRHQPGRPPGERAAGLLLLVETWAFGAAVFFRDQLGSRFDRVVGNDGDARLVVVLHEHWYSVLRGDERWMDPSFFHPTRGVLGYADTFFLNGLLYVPLRAAHLDPFLAFQLTLIMMSAIGFGALYVALAKYLRVRPAFAAGGCLLYCFANNMFIKVGHPQLITSWWTPLCALAGLVAVKHRHARVRLASAACCGGLASLIVYSSFYVGWTALAAAAVVALLVAVAQPKAAVAFCRRRWPELAVATGGALVAAIPFALTYLPVLRRTGGRSYEEVQLYAPQPGDLVNVGSANYVWGSTLRQVFGPDDPRLQNGERMLAVTPLLMLVTIGLAVLVVLIGRRRPPRAPTPPREADTPPTGGGPLFACSSLAGAIALALLPLNIDGWSLWRPIWEHVPGASALRAIGRLEIVGSQLVSISLAILLSRLLDLVRGRRLRTMVHSGALAVLGLILIEQLNLSPSSLVDRSEQMRKLEETPTAPTGCASFFVTTSGPPVPAAFLQIDAMLIAGHTGLPTVNGYSGQTPAGWLLHEPQGPAYLDAIRAWAASTGTSAGLCGYDLTTRIWDVTPLS